MYLPVVLDCVGWGQDQRDLKHPYAVASFAMVEDSATLQDGEDPLKRNLIGRVNDRTTCTKHRNLPDHPDAETVY